MLAMGCMANHYGLILLVDRHWFRSRMFCHRFHLLCLFCFGFPRPLLICQPRPRGM